jgi:hypothetical protein
MQQSLFDHIADDGGDENNIGQEALEGIEVQGVSKVLHTFVLQVFFYTDTIIHYASLAQGLVVRQVLGLGLKDSTFFQIFDGEQEDSLFITELQKDTRTCDSFGKLLVSLPMICFSGTLHFFHVQTE